MPLVIMRHPDRQCEAVGELDHPAGVARLGENVQRESRVAARDVELPVRWPAVHSMELRTKSRGRREAKVTTGNNSFATAITHKLLGLSLLSPSINLFR
jgi:hypothetical protein